MRSEWRLDGARADGGLIEESNLFYCGRLALRASSANSVDQTVVATFRMYIGSSAAFAYPEDQERGREEPRRGLFFVPLPRFTGFDRHQHYLARRHILSFILFRALAPPWG